MWHIFWFYFMQDLSAVGQALCCNWPISFLLRIVAVCAELSGAPSPSNQPHSLQTEQEAHCRRSGSLLGRKPAPGGKMRLVCRQFWVVATRSWCCIAPNVLPHLITFNPCSAIVLSTYNETVGVYLFTCGLGICCLVPRLPIPVWIFYAELGRRSFQMQIPHFASCPKDGYFESMLSLAWRNSALAKPCTGWIVDGMLEVLKLCGTCWWSPAAVFIGKVEL